MPLHDQAFYATLFFILGVAAAAFGIGIYWVLAGALLLAYFFFRLKVKAVVALTLVTFLGAFYLELHQVINKDQLPLTGERFQALVISEPEEAIGFTEVYLGMEDPYKGKVFLYTEPGRRYEYGYLLQIEGAVEVSPTGRNIVSFPEEIEVINRRRGSAFKKALIDMKSALLGNIQSALPAKQAALASGILLGERAEFTDDFEEAMRQSGTTHIVALSGYNIAILAAVLFATFSYIWSKRGAFYVSLAVIPGFVVMTGAEPSVVRAGIMGLILLLAEHRGRPYSFRNAITFTAFVMLLFNPTIVSEDVGFQLSFTALLGIVYLYPLLTKKLKVSGDGLLAWKKNVLQTAAAQIAVFPIVMGTFGFFSPSALVSNVLILELIPITMLLSFAVAVLGFLSFHLSLVVGWITSIFLNYEIFIIEFFGSYWT